MSRSDDYQWLFRKAPAMATAIDQEGRYLDVNDAFEHRLGYARDEMIGRRPLDFLEVLADVVLASDGRRRQRRHRLVRRR